MLTLLLLVLALCLLPVVLTIGFWLLHCVIEAFPTIIGVVLCLWALRACF